MTISDSVFDAKHIRCVPVIAVFSTSGVIKPLYVTVNWTKLKIENYTVQDNAFGDNWIYFLCDVKTSDAAVKEALETVGKAFAEYQATAAGKNAPTLLFFGNPRKDYPLKGK